MALGEVTTTPYRPRLQPHSAWLAAMLAGQLALGFRDLTPDDPVTCSPLSCTLKASACVARHAARTASGHGKGYPVFEGCAQCVYGAHRRLLLAVSGWSPKPWRAFSPGAATAQHMARWLYLASQPLDYDPVE